MSHIKCLSLLSILALFFVATSGCSDEYPPEIDIEIRRHEGSEPGFFIKVGKKEYRGEGLMESFIGDLEEHIVLRPELKATFHIDDYMSNSENFDEHVWSTARKAAEVGLRNIKVHVPESVKSGEDGYRLPSEVEDVVLPKADCCDNLREPKHRHLIVTISRPGHYIQDRRDWGHVGQSLGKIRRHILKEANAAGRDPDGYSNLEVLIRADAEAEYEWVSQIREACRESEVKAYKTSLGCAQNELEIPLDGKFPHKLKDGLIDLYLRKNPPLTRREVIAWMGTREDRVVSITLSTVSLCGKQFRIQVDNQKLSEEGSLNEVYQIIKGRRQERPDVEVVIFPDEVSLVGHVVSVMNECLRAEVKNIRVIGF